MTYVYAGNGEYVPGVPARDLTDEEWASLTKDEQAQAASLYRKDDGKKKGGE